MLVLARKVGEKIILNDDIEIIVLDSNQNTVRIGVNAPKNVTVYREELYREIKNANISSKEVTEKSVKELHELIKDRKNNFSSSTYDSLTNKISKN
ncbi:MAG: carbon storage regulator CsrA [Candidatus Gastranaerophilaceae bacterium]|jgi:carbon storage regulator|uniref:Translational regulator CsrA n=1 Tax=Candidatus Limenecus avicola TaxID=2840847 RepID=A0A9D1SR03_9CLOT|nr:carbon storage regulator CsrA [Clostridium sp.]CDC17897.1 carbon storage regulator homolog [Clostridium sp. CAG:306]DAB24461.1 MAG TPA: carbon storage regulator [Candidatus Gastranaerophilales bacterium HUM_21]HIU91557.1 carbon storage regulator CsrA [Candidatus Limenecus avicola]